jgi:hypothetical protein
MPAVTVSFTGSQNNSVQSNSDMTPVWNQTQEYAKVVHGDQVSVSLAGTLPHKHYLVLCGPVIVSEVRSVVILLLHFPLTNFGGLAAITMAHGSESSASISLGTRR